MIEETDLTYPEIGKEFGVSREVVAQVSLENGGLRNNNRFYGPGAREKSLERQARVLGLLQNKELTYEKIAEISDVSKSFVVKLAGKHSLYRNAPPHNKRRPLPRRTYEEQAEAVKAGIKVAEHYTTKGALIAEPPAIVRDVPHQAPYRQATKPRRVWTPGKIKPPTKAQLMGGKCY